MRQIYPDLWQTSPENPVPDTPQGTAHAYLLLREDGNILFYGIGRQEKDGDEMARDLRRMQELGGITHQILAHWHEASPSLSRIKQMFGSSLCCHEREAPEVSRIGGLGVDHLIRGNETLLGDVEALWTPGHTAGSTCFLYASPHGKTYLFTGDTIVPGHGSWLSAAMGGSESDLKMSLERLRGLKPDAVMAAGALAPDTHRQVSPSDWQSAVDEATKALG